MNLLKKIVAILLITSLVSPLAQAILPEPMVPEAFTSRIQEAVKSEFSLNAVCDFARNNLNKVSGFVVANKYAVGAVAGLTVFGIAYNKSAKVRQATKNGIKGAYNAVAGLIRKFPGTAAITLPALGAYAIAPEKCLAGAKAAQAFALKNVESAKAALDNAVVSTKLMGNTLVSKIPVEATKAGFKTACELVKTNAHTLYDQITTHPKTSIGVVGGLFVAYGLKEIYDEHQRQAYSYNCSR